MSHCNQLTDQQSSVTVGSFHTNAAAPENHELSAAGKCWRRGRKLEPDNTRQILGLQVEFPLHNKFNVYQSFQLFNGEEQATSSPLMPKLEKQIKQAKARINKLETEGSSTKNKVDQFLQKLSEEMTAWRSREHQKVGEVLDDMKAELSREKRHCRRLEMVHSEERKNREVAEEVCDQIAQDTGEVERKKMELKKLWEEIEEEKKKLQMAEVWLEERVQMKLADAKVIRRKALTDEQDNH